MYKKIKIYSFILAAIYVTIIAYDSQFLWEGVKAAVSKTYSEKKSGHESEVFHFMVKPDQGRYSFPEYTTNVLNNKNIRLEATEYMILVPDIPAKTTLQNIDGGIKVILSLGILGVILYIPFLIFSIIKSATKDQILDRKVIRRIRRIGYFLIMIFFTNVYYYVSSYYIAESIVKVKGYTAILDFSNYTTLVLGVVTLLMAEIMKISLHLKEEQDLTI